VHQNRQPAPHTTVAWRRRTKRYRGGRKEQGKTERLRKKRRPANPIHRMPTWAMFSLSSAPKQPTEQKAAKQMKPTSSTVLFVLCCLKRRKITEAGGFR